MRGEIMSRTSILLADDHVMLLDVLVRLLEQDFDVLGTCAWRIRAHAAIGV